MYILLSIGSRPAGEGIGSVIIWALTVIAALGLMYGVLELMAHFHRKKEEEQEKKSDGSFPAVLDREIRKRDSEDDK